MGPLLFAGRLLLLLGLYAVAYGVAREIWRELPDRRDEARIPRFVVLRLRKAAGSVSANGVPWPEGERVSLALPASFGRQAGNAVRIDDPFVSACHMELISDGTDVWLVDQGSKNGTWVGQKRLEKPTRIRAGGVIQLGGTVFGLEE